MTDVNVKDVCVIVTEAYITVAGNKYVHLTTSKCGFQDPVSGPTHL